MTATLIHKGSDDGNYWLDREAGIALGYRSLTLRKPSEPTRPFMTSLSGRYTLAVDGAIYNHMTLRKRLNTEGYTQWRCASDTETLLAAFSCWGIRRTLQACIGMFAIALWDNKTRRLTLVRDRMGEKPLYYGWMRKDFLFGSELKALQAHQGWNAHINREAIASQLHLSHIPAPMTIYQHIFKLEPGHLLQVTPQTLPGSQLQPEAWWSLAEQITQTRSTSLPEHLLRRSQASADLLEKRLSHVIRQQIHTDVPIGTLLSGGVGSSLIAALMQAQSNRPIKTFTIGYGSNGRQEASQARTVARYLGTEHTEFITTPADALEIITQLPILFDEPFSDAAQIPTLLMTQLAQTKVNISLSGCGADELFGGYYRYSYAKQLWMRLQHLPSFLRNTLATTLRHYDAQRWNNASEMLDSRSPEDIYRRMISHWKQPEEIVLGIQSTPDPLPSNIPAQLNFTERMMYMDALGYLPNAVLTKMDRANRSTNLETRAPFLDRRIVEFAWQLPLRMKIRNGQGAWLPRQVLKRYIPPQLSNAPQANTHAPLGEWLRTSLRDWAESLLDASRLRQEGFFDPTPIREKWQQHLSGKHNWQDYLWDVLMFQAWHEQQTPAIRAMAA